jgi:hypothetical protein
MTTPTISFKIPNGARYGFSLEGESGEMTPTRIVTDHTPYGNATLVYEPHPGEHLTLKWKVQFSPGIVPTNELREFTEWQGNCAQDIEITDSENGIGTMSMPHGSCKLKAVYDLILFD